MRLKAYIDASEGSPKRNVYAHALPHSFFVTPCSYDFAFSAGAAQGEFEGYDASREYKQAADVLEVLAPNPCRYNPKPPIITTPNPQQHLEKSGKDFYFSSSLFFSPFRASYNNK